MLSKTSRSMLEIIVFSALMIWICASAQAQTAQKSSDWKFSLGAGVIYAPEFEGSKDYKASPFPFGEIRYKDRYYLSAADGLGGDFFMGENFTVGAALGYDGGRDDDGHLRGLGKIDPTAVMKIYGEYEFGPVSFGLDTEFDLLSKGHEGLLVTPSISYGGFMPKLSLFYSLSASATYADDNYMQNMFGVSATQAAATSFQSYDAKHGFKSVGLDATVGYMFNPKWSVVGLAGVSKLVGDAADSPIVQDKTQFTTGVFLKYTF